MFQENFVNDDVLHISPIMCAVRELLGDVPLESFEIEYFAEDLDGVILNARLKAFKKAVEVFKRASMGDISHFVYLDEATYTWKHLQ